MTLREEILKAKEDSYEAWFKEKYVDRYADHINKFKEIAKKGKTETVIHLTEVYDEEERTMKANPKFVQDIKNLFNDLDVYTEDIEKTKLTFGAKGFEFVNIPCKELIISWREEGK